MGSPEQGGLRIKDESNHVPGESKGSTEFELAFRCRKVLVLSLEFLDIVGV